MDFTFLHAADLHLGSPLRGLSRKDEDLFNRVVSAGRDAFSKLVDTAIEERVAFALIAGDLYDGDWRDVSIGLFFNREISRLSRVGIPVFIVRGNHDAESQMSRALPLPKGVVYFSSRKTETHLLESLKVAIHGRSFSDRAVTENYAASYPAPKSGWFNIGVLHSSCEGHSAHAVYAPCTIAELAASGYEYWALGHVHEFSVLHEYPHIIYPGNLQGRSVRECGPKGAVLVDVRADRIERIRRLFVDKARWRHISLALTPDMMKRDILEAVKSKAARDLEEDTDRISVVRVTFSGQTPLHGALIAAQNEWRDDIQSLLHQIDLDMWLESLKIATCETIVPETRAEGDFNPCALLEEIETDDDLLKSVQEFMDLVRSKMPKFSEQETQNSVFDQDALIKNARALALARIKARH